MSDDTRETIPITSPLAVLTTRTTQEHIVNTHSTTDLKPGDIVQHPMWGNGVVAYTKFGLRIIGTSHGDECIFGVTGWQRVETIRPGHVQVRVNDLDLSRWEGVFEGGWNHSTRVAIRAANAISAQRAESTPPADEPEVVGDGCECWVTPEHMWTTYYGAVEPGSQIEYNSRCPKHGEKPTSTTVTLPCPNCGEAITRSAQVWTGSQRDRGLTWATLELHTCQPVQPDEPTEFAARATVTLPDGTREKWCRLGQNHPAPWLGEAYDVPGEEWGLLCQRGTVTIGWEE